VLPARRRGRPGVLERAGGPRRSTRARRGLVRVRARHRSIRPQKRLADSRDQDSLTYAGGPERRSGVHLRRSPANPAESWFPWSYRSGKRDPHGGEPGVASSPTTAGVVRRSERWTNLWSD
jgi:hypothetical protein